MIPQKQKLFFSSQTLRWLDEAGDRQQFLQPSAFRVERAGAAQVDRQNVGNWQPIERTELVDQILADGDDWKRVVFTTDAGLGKSTNLEWLRHAINKRRDRHLAFLLNMTDLDKLTVDGVLEKLLERFRQVEGNSTLRLVPNANASHDRGRQMLEQWRQRGLIVLILDGLDQALPQQIATLKQLLESDAWRHCRFILGGRPHALQTHWKNLFADVSPPFQFVRLDEFDENQQRRFLGLTQDGKSRWEQIPSEARGILTVPRVLEYLRDRVPDAELSQIKTASDVYWKSTQHMVKEALTNSAEARRMGQRAGTDPPTVPTAAQMGYTIELLAAIAYAMTSQLTADTDESSETHGRLIANFALINPGVSFKDFRLEICQLITNKREPSLDDQERVDSRLDALGAANDAVSSGFYDSDTSGLNGILWRNRTLQEFFAALWCAAYATPEQSRNLWDWLYVAGDVTTEQYYWVNRFLAEMPEAARSPMVWVNSLEPVYRPGDGTIAGTKRSTEMLFRSWRAMHELAGEPVFDWWDCSYEELIEKEKKLKQGEPGGVSPRTNAGHVRGLTPASSPIPPARKVLAAFKGEFQRILDGTHGATLTPKERAARQAAAKELTENFIDVAAGRFRMGAPDEKQGMGAKLRQQWEGVLAQTGDPDTIARRILDRGHSEKGPRGDQRHENSVAYWAGLIELRNVNEIESRQYTKNETPEKGEEVQEVAAFALGASPVLTEWSRLFDPAHGDGPWYGKQFAKISQTPRDPVIYASWWDSWALSEWLCWSVCQDVVYCRLPHEPEFEFVAKDAEHWDWNYWWGDDFEAADLAKCNGDCRIGATRPPEQATPFREFRDLLGNVWEWMANRYREKYSRREPPDDEKIRVLRGGAWDVDPTDCRSAFHLRCMPDVRTSNSGLRLVCVVCVRTS